AHEAEVRAFLGQFGPEVAEEDGDAQGVDFEAQCTAMLAAGPSVISSIMGLYPPHIVAQMKDRGVKWFATVTTVTEALAAEAAGADVIVAQGMEAGGHRGAFEAGDAPRALIGLFALLPAVVDAVKVPVVATGGIADARGVAAALMLGASAVQIGTGLLRTPEAGIAPAWAEALGTAKP
ncbi:MAG: nitronate monooxygenase, partial [Planctomycetota bacterium]